MINYLYCKQNINIGNMLISLLDLYVKKDLYTVLYYFLMCIIFHHHYTEPFTRCNQGFVWTFLLLFRHIISITKSISHNLSRLKLLVSSRQSLVSQACCPLSHCSLVPLSGTHTSICQLLVRWEEFLRAKFSRLNLFI